MRIEITGDTEKLIQAQLASGQFRTPDECVEAMARHWLQSHHGGPAAFPTLPETTDIEAVAAAQGVGPCDDPNRLQTNLWPDDEPVDEFLTFLREIRHDDHADRAP